MVKTLIAEQTINVGEFERFWRNYKACSRANFTIGYVRGRIQELDRQWDEFRATHKQILLKLASKPSEDDYFKNDVFDVYENKYFLWKGTLLDALENIGSKTTEQIQVKAAAPVKVSDEIKLPRITLPKFSGKYTDWTSFHDLFVSLVHNNSNVPNVHKLHFLKTSLTGEAESLIKHFSISEANYNPAWNYLCKRYDNKRILINSQLSVFFSLPKVSQENSQAVKHLLDVSLEALESIRALGVDISSWDPIVVHVMTQKLPTETHQLWEQSLGMKTELPSFEELKTFLETRFRTLEATDNHKANKDNRPRPENSFQAYHTSIPCKICRNGTHSIRQCQQFVKLDPRKRQELVRKNNCCTNCLAQSHSFKDCKSTQTCFTCNRRHHTMLHFAPKTDSGASKPSTSTSLVAQTVDTTTQNPTQPSNLNTTQTTQQSNTAIPNAQASVFEPRPSTSKVQTYHTETHKQILLATALVFAIHNNKQITLRALIDPGSQASFVTESVCQLLSLPRLPTMAAITGLGKTQTATSKSMVTLRIGSRISDFSMDIQAIALPSLTDTLPSQEVPTQLLAPFQDIRLADPFFYCPGNIDIILGADVYPYILLDGLRHGVEGTPLAQNTRLGWIFSGRAPCSEPEERSITSFFNKLDLDSRLMRFWEIEEVAVEKPRTDDEKLCEKFFQDTVSRTESGRYMVRLPFRQFTEPHIQLGNSRGVAFRRLLSLKTKFMRDPELYALYKTSIEEYLALGQLTRVPLDEINSPDTFYLPHHAVYKGQGPAKKLRVVFDASAKSSTGKSLNDMLMVGPALQPNILDIILRFRKYATVFTTDIEKMYPQILIHPDDANYQRILWMDSLNGAIYDLKFQVVVFGVSSSPFLAIRTLQKLANDERGKFPIAAHIVETNSYVDDILTGADTVEGALEAQDQLLRLLGSAGFKLKKWASNDEKLLERIPASDRLMDVPLHMDLDRAIKTLGIIWNPVKDEFGFQVNMKSEITPTKRTVLSATATLYDPLGWVAPAIIIAKIFMQTLWLAGLDWDDVLPNHLQRHWTDFTAAIKDLEKIRISRFVNCTTSTSCQLHGFSDASEKAYAAAIYLRTVDKNGKVNVQLLAAKTRVAPVKVVSLPRLELCGAVLLARLLNDIKKSMNLDGVPIYAWTDSSIVLTWLRGHPSKWKCFVGNRVTEIITHIPPSNWRHVSSQDNPSDIASRGVSPDQLPNYTQWWHGPQWLSMPELEWPKSTVDIPDNPALEMRKVQAMVNVSKEDFKLSFLTRFSSLQKLLVATAYWRRFMFNCRISVAARKNLVAPQDSQMLTGPLVPDELSSATNFWILFIQQHSFPEESADLKLRRGISPKSKLNPFAPFVDEKGIIRLGGRLERASMSYGQKHPIILPYSSHLTKLIVLDQHEKSLHGGVQLTLNLLRKKYWILKARSAVKACIHRCVICFRQQGKASVQLMANLPLTRITVSRPFSNTGVDYAGPLAVRMSKGRGCRSYKGYIAIFVCFATRATHLEVVSDLTTEAFLAAFRRFIARRGLCTNLYSDCGTNFVGASSRLDNELKAAIDANNSLASTLAKEGIQWHFNPPGAPHFGGLWEAGVKSMKHHLRRIMGNNTLTYEELSTLVTQIEACLNSRPLCPLTDDPTDSTALTPGHFLIGEALLAPPEPPLESANLSALKRWQLIQRLRQNFWKQWSNEYLARLQQRPKWTITKPNLKVGELVLIKEENFSPLKWPLGRILELHPGDDDLVRVATIKTQQGIVIRPIAKLCVLPIDVTPQTLAD